MQEEDVMLVVTKKHREFQDRLVKSIPDVELVAEWLREHGRIVEIPETKIADTAAQHREFSDHGDLFILCPGGRKRIEVKALKKTSFTCRSDWPHKHVFVASKHSIDRSIEEVTAWVLLSKERTHVGIIMPDTRPHWYLWTGKCENTGNIETKYAVHKDHVIFRPIA